MPEPHAPAETAGLPEIHPQGHADEMRTALNATLEREARELVPWFLEQMPEYYFRTHSGQEQLDHLHALVSGQVLSQRRTLTLRSPCGTRVTHIMPGCDMRTLTDAVATLADTRIRTARLYSTRDKSLRLDTYLLDEQPQCEAGGVPFEAALRSVGAEGLEIPGGEEEFRAFLATATEDYVDKFEPGRAIRHFEMCRCLAGTERVHLRLDPDAGEGVDRVMVAMANPPARGVLTAALKIFTREGYLVRRAYGDEFESRGETQLVMSFYVERGEGGLAEDSEDWRRLERQLKTIKWFAFHGLERLAEENGWEIGRVMLMQAACEFAHQFLIRKSIYKYTSASIVRAALRNRDALDLLARFFEARFDPAFAGDRASAVAALREDVHRLLRDITDDVERKILGYVLRFFQNVQRTNYFVPGRFGLSFRMNPAVLPRGEDGRDEEPPFGFYCFHGPHCFGFQVRYRDMARGGVRLVPTRTQEQFEIESNRLFDEVTKLARAQQYKNKDIPEGGSKAVLLLGPQAEADLALKSMVDSFLDLLATDGDGKLDPHVVDYLNRDEIIYLGPDENITPEHIRWIVARAAKRGYRWPAAFMSSKPRVGISHKQYGVTSEGVVVFADEVLKALGINPLAEPFTVKLTGGPAGDVASNVVKILIREYGKNARIVAMSDGHGAVYDPDGLDHGELLRLIGAVGRAHQFDPARLTGQGAFVRSTDTPEGVRARDDLHNTARADLFIPSGGRPDTINERNWHRFLGPDGTPSARGIVEGANIFISAGARARFEEHGVLCVPGPSANKTGVICSSYEILAGLALSDDEFLEIKDQYVAQLLDILRLRARSEARVLLRERRLSGGSQTLTDLSYRLSRAINTLCDDIAAVLREDDADPATEPVLRDLLLAYCPAVFAQRYPERILGRIPRAHQHALLAAYIASKILYNEGLGWVDPLVRARGVREVVHAYLVQERRVAALAGAVRASGSADCALAASIIEAAGRKALTARELGLE